MSRSQRRFRLPQVQTPCKVEFKVEVKGLAHQCRARVAKVTHWDDGRTSTSTWWVAQYIPGYHVRWDAYRARKAATAVCHLAQAMGGVQ